MQIVPLAECPQYVDAVTQWIWDEWQGGEAGETFAETKRVLIGSPKSPPTLVACDADVPVGVIGFRRVMFRGREPRLLFVNSLFVVPEQRGRGVGTALLRDALARVGPADESVYAYATIRAWYEARGFCVVEAQREGGGALLRITKPFDAV